MSIYKAGRPTKYNPSTGRGTKPPSKPGEYRIRDKNGILNYIGETCDLNRRCNEHKRSRKLMDGGSFEFMIADGRSTSKTRRKHEKKKILLHNPLLNRSTGGEGRIAKKH